MGFARNKEIQEANENGQYYYSTFRKVPAIASTQNTWIDLSSAPGNPVPNYYATAGLTSATLQSKNGLYHGGDVSPKSKHLHKISIASLSAGVAPGVFTLCDYLLYYPLIDMDSTDEQVLTNSVPLPRYADGFGVKAFLVATNPFVGGASFTINYTNQDGVAGNISQVNATNTTTTIGTIIHSGTANNTSNFIKLNTLDRGIRSIESVTFLAPNGGLGALVLVKPIATILVREITAFTEFDYFMMKQNMPRIYDGAYLNFLCMPNGSVAGVPILGELSTIWN